MRELRVKKSTKKMLLDFSPPMTANTSRHIGPVRLGPQVQWRALSAFMPMIAVAIGLGCAMPADTNQTVCSEDRFICDPRDAQTWLICNMEKLSGMAAQEPSAALAVEIELWLRDNCTPEWLAICQPDLDEISWNLGAALKDTVRPLSHGSREKRYTVYEPALTVDRKSNSARAVLEFGVLDSKLSTLVMLNLVVRNGQWKITQPMEALSGEEYLQIQSDICGQIGRRLVEMLPESPRELLITTHETRFHGWELAASVDVYDGLAQRMASARGVFEFDPVTNAFFFSRLEVKKVTK